MRGIGGLAPQLVNLPSGCAFPSTLSPGLRALPASDSGLPRGVATTMGGLPSAGGKTMTAPLIEFRNVTKVFGGGMFDKSRTIALENYSMVLDAEPPAITAVVGESGSGKTTLARLLLGLENPTQGEVLYRGQNIHAMSKVERRNFLTDVQVVFQDPYGVYNPFYKVDHVLTKPISKFKLAKSKREARELIKEVLLTVGLQPEETLGRYPHQMSGGQRQRIMVARALLLNPKLIIADEPVSMVDASLRATILSNIQRLNEEFRHFDHLHHARSGDRIPDLS